MGYVVRKNSKHKTDMISQILIMVDTSNVAIHHSKHPMPIHYETIEDAQKKKKKLKLKD